MPITEGWKQQKKDLLMSTVTLHQWERSPFCAKVRKVLRHKRIAFEVVNYNGLLGRRPRLLSSVGQLPVLDYDGDRVQDSTEIIEFLERRVPQPSVIPADPYIRATAMLLEDWADESLSWYGMATFEMGDPIALGDHIDSICSGRPRWERIPVGIAVKSMYRKKLRNQGLGRLSLSQVLQRLDIHLASLEALLSQETWLAGNMKSIADISVSCQLDLLIRTEVAAQRIVKYPSLAAWLERCA
ncbi:glutathione S-transferase family protein [Paraburkholderia sp. BR14263]|uniref:glutathione S-transferase family protein n=1 Tax=unclassified Paraburkholderia TaxID=2615204 RepID=UPI0034CF9E2E